MVGLVVAKPTQEDFFILPSRDTYWGSIKIERTKKNITQR